MITFDIWSSDRHLFKLNVFCTNLKFSNEFLCLFDVTLIMYKFITYNGQLMLHVSQPLF